LKKILTLVSILLAFNSTTFASDEEPMDVYNNMIEKLSGSWSLSSADKQTNTTGAYKNKAIVHLVGTDKTAIGYKVIGRGTTVQEELFEGTRKEMVTMYHCNNFSDCTQLRATHYCAKRNQPEFLLNTKETTDTKFVFDCNMATELCNSSEDHVHKIIHELSNDDKHLKSSYLGWKNQKLNKKNSIYHFDKK